MTQNKIALVTGGSRGLGKDMAIALSKKNIDVILTYNANKTAADEVVATINANGQKAVALPFDVSDIKSYPDFLNQVLSTLKKIGTPDQFDFLINNAVSEQRFRLQSYEEAFDN